MVSYLGAQLFGFCEATIKKHDLYNYSKIVLYMFIFKSLINVRWWLSILFFQFMRTNLDTIYEEMKHIWKKIP